jgi:hypothetical protein
LVPWHSHSTSIPQSRLKPPLPGSAKVFSAEHQR